ncbi:hypothetical protein K439DRAFT_1635954, partial [Ramaria rubella]
MLRSVVLQINVPLRCQIRRVSLRIVYDVLIEVCRFSLAGEGFGSMKNSSSTTI